MRRRLAELEDGIGDVATPELFDQTLAMLRHTPEDRDDDLGVVLLWLFELRSLRFDVRQLARLVGAIQSSVPEPAPAPIEAEPAAPALELIRCLTLAPAGPPAPAFLSRAACVAAASSPQRVAAA